MSHVDTLSRIPIIAAVDEYDVGVNIQMAQIRDINI